MKPCCDDCFQRCNKEEVCVASFNLGDVMDPSAFWRGMGKIGVIALADNVFLEDVRKQRNKRASAIFSDFNLLKSILDRHEDVIRKRWRKKKEFQRLNILERSRGNAIPTQHRPDIEAYRKINNDVDPSRLFRDAFMWPYINQEDLASSDALLSLLHARGRNEPTSFVATDLSTMHLGRMANIIKQVFLEKYVMVFRTRSDAMTYGELLEYDDPASCHDRWYTHIHSLGEGMLILEAQERLMSFLVKTARELLSDISEEQLRNGPIKPPPSSMLQTKPDITSLTKMTTEAPYKLPSELDLSGIISLLAAKRDEAIDHHWSLREDPDYFSHCMKISHDTFNKPASIPVYQCADKASHDAARRWGQVLSTEISMSYFQVENWSRLHRRFAELHEKQLKIETMSEPAEDLRVEYLTKLLILRHLLSEASKRYMIVLEQAMTVSVPGFASFSFQERHKYKNKLPKEHQKLLFLLQFFRQSQRQSLIWVGITTVMDELGRFLEASSSARNMLTPFITNLIADLSIATQCLGQLNSYQPWAKWYTVCAISRKQLEMVYSFTMCHIDGIAYALSQNEAIMTLAKLGTPTKVDFRYPANKGRTKEISDTMRRAEANLDEFWKAVDQIMDPKHETFRNTAIQSMVNMSRSLFRTPEWTDAEGHEANSPAKAASSYHQPLSHMYLDLQERTESTLDTSTKTTTSTPRHKTKSRGQPSTPITPTPIPTIPKMPSISNQRTLIEVNYRIMKVFSVLFFTQSPTATPGEIMWTDFLHAMTSLDFQVKKLHGSMWQFSPTKPGLGRNIIFHEPHPSSKIPFNTARRYGRRLNRVYGWHGGMFVLARPKTGDAKVKK